MPRVKAYHLILTTYGFWLPNDPRGSWSEFVRAWELLEFGPATKVTTKRSLARDPHDYRSRIDAKKHLARKDVWLNGMQARAVGRGFAKFVEKSGVIVRACSILPRHAHLVVERHRYPIEQIANLLKGAASRESIEEGLHPFADQSYRDGTIPTFWSRGQWNVFLGEDADIERAMKYVEENPIKDNKPAQHWSFVKPPARSGRAGGPPSRRNEVDWDPYP
jgi:REP element-mobilizing transposase RayT